MTMNAQQEPAIREGWEYTACPGCKSTQGKLVLSLRDKCAALGIPEAGIWKCQDCSLAFLNPRPNSATIGDYYPQGYEPYHIQAPVKAGKNSSKDFSHRPPRDGATLLDIGCGGGAFLAKMQNLGWKVMGLDFSSHAVEQTRARNIEAHHGGLDHPAISSRLFDAVTMRQVLEHIHDPLDFLQGVRKILARDGMVSISVPNLDSLAYRLFGEDWRAVDVPRHLSYFNPKSLASLLASAGYKRVEIGFIRHAGWMRDSAQNARASGRVGYWKRLLETRIGSSIASRWASLTGQCDCIQALAFSREDSGLSV